MISTMHDLLVENAALSFRVAELGALVEDAYNEGFADGHPRITESRCDVTAPDVLRWHCHPDHRLRNSGDGINRHQPAVAALAGTICARLSLTCNDSRVIDYCLRHDEPERIFGDWPGPICKRPDVAAIKAALEAEFWANHPNPLPKLTALEYLIFDLCDKMEAVIWARGVGVTLADDIEQCRAKAYAIGPQATAWIEDQLQ